MGCASPANQVDEKRLGVSVAEVITGTFQVVAIPHDQRQDVLDRDWEPACLPPDNGEDYDFDCELHTEPVLSPDDSQGWAVTMEDERCWSATRFHDDSELPKNELDKLLPTDPDADQRRYLTALKRLEGCI